MSVGYCSGPLVRIFLELRAKKLQKSHFDSSNNAILSAILQTCIYQICWLKQRIYGNPKEDTSVINEQIIGTQPVSHRNTEAGTGKNCLMNVKIWKLFLKFYYNASKRVLIINFYNHDVNRNFNR